MKKFALLSLGALVALVVGCTDRGGLVELEEDPADIFWDLRLNQTAINLALDESEPEYHTFQLEASAVKLDGSPYELVGDERLEFVTSDTSRVQVTEYGLIQAVGETPSASPITIIATMTAGRGPVTNADTASVAVTQDVRPIETFSIQPLRTTYGVGYDTTMAARTLDANGQPVTGTLVAYESSIEKIVNYDADGVARPMNMGTAVLRASTMNYGTEHRDSIELTIVEPEVFQVINDIDLDSEDLDLIFRPEEITIKAGQGVAWVPGNAGCVYGIAFDDATNIGPSPVDGSTGDVPFFCGAGLREIRIFNEPGTYTYQGSDLFGFPTSGEPKVIVEP